ncbi:GNAT family N-acetyltransferase [Xanthobacter dioxanivorans]|uniref:GNAT family N-acetyltransferase n=1 Tax=Xanthobacter dioxanivorans TaxID=2528964 RepID=A0A974PMS9_9HYPH|nr:GNAT family N-acetyltransferase [Xanthobacter dioxanivorans]QRG06478.1 GNAT family N-acetyltransferase [Xanthobacter dioxanivorans]
MTEQVAPGIIRKLWTGETGLFRDHLLRLDTESRRFRFGSAVSAEFIERYASRVFRTGAIVHGCFVDGELRAAAELYPMGDVLPGEAEAAFSVEHEFQNHGLGTLLLERVILTARNRGIRTLCMNCLAHNRRMQQIARKFDAELSFDTDEVVAELTAPFPTALSLAQEAAADAQGVAGAVLQAQRLATGRLFDWFMPGQPISEVELEAH